jgi:hypothetical protein
MMFLLRDQMTEKKEMKSLLSVENLGLEVLQNQFAFEMMENLAVDCQE